jgi:hypothetical protein
VHAQHNRAVFEIADFLANVLGEKEPRPAEQVAQANADD